MRKLGLDAGLSESAVKHMVYGNAQSPRHENLEKIARALSLTVDELLKGTAPKAPLAARYFAAARWACWEDNLDLAADRLKVSKELLQQIERGDADASSELLTRFHMCSGFPLRWFLEGSWDDVPSPLGGRAGAFDPDLVPEVPGAEYRGGSLGAARGGSSEA